MVVAAAAELVVLVVVVVVAIVNGRGRSHTTVRALLDNYRLYFQPSVLAANCNVEQEGGKEVYRQCASTSALDSEWSIRFTYRNENRCPLKWTLHGPQRRSGRFWMREKLRPGCEIRSFQSVSQSLYRRRHPGPRSVFPPSSI